MERRIWVLVCVLGCGGGDGRGGWPMRGLQLTNYDGNILAFSPDGRVLDVADRQANRLVCIEPIAR